ncbi:MAG: sensor histidine kinase [Acidimicrobiales bacterium]
MSSLSLRARVFAGLLVVALAVAAMVALVTTTTRAYLVDQIDDQLRAAASTDRDGRLRLPEGHRPRPGVPNGSVQSFSSMYEAVVDDAGDIEVVYTPNLPGKTYSPPDLTDVEELADAGRPVTVDARDGSTHYRLLSSTSGDDTIIRAIPLADVDATTARLVAYQAVGLVAVIALLGAVAWWVDRLGVAPIKRMTGTASKIAAGDLDARVDESTPGTESGELARSLNVMLSRISAAVDNQQQSEQRLRRFVADASHELRTPLTTIGGYAQLYGMGGLDDRAALDDAMRRTGQEADRMGRLVEEMLTLAKLDQHRPLDQRPVDVSALAADVAGDAEVTNPDRAFTTAITPGVVVTGDEDRLRQVVANVVGNATTHTPDGTPVTITVGVEGPTARIDVHDDGPGMTPEVAARITERFYRADVSRSRQNGGSGLGMAIVAAVVEAHHGDLAVSSAPGAGTTITIRLPLVPTAAEPGTHENRLAPNGGPGPAADQERSAP